MKRGKGNPIPNRVRLIVLEREGERCFRCGMRGYEMSHRRRRGVRDGHEHSPANILLFCRTCHAFLHANPTEAMKRGWAVSSYVDDVRDVLVLRWDGAWVRLEHDGTTLLSYRSA